MLFFFFYPEALMIISVKDTSSVSGKGSPLSKKRRNASEFKVVNARAIFVSETCAKVFALLKLTLASTNEPSELLWFVANTWPIFCPTAMFTRRAWLLRV